MTDTENTASEPSPARPPVIESATASTACQTNGSNFSYILTGSVLGVVVVVAAAVLVLLFAIASSGSSGYSGYSLDDGLSNGYGYDDGYSDDLGSDGSDGYEDGDTFGFSYESSFDGTRTA